MMLKSLACALSVAAVAQGKALDMAAIAEEMPIQVAETLSFGTLAQCQDARCLWADSNGKLVERDELIRQLMASENLHPGDAASERRRLDLHMRYIEDVHQLARAEGIRFPYRMGVNARHLYLDDTRTQTPHEFVHQEVHARRRRRLEEAEAPKAASHRRLANVPATLNWCGTDNPLGKNICTPIKSQNKCGSCWAFAATDAIETAVAVASKKVPIALSPQQFLDCSKREMTTTFQYCWAAGGVKGASWLEKEMRWASQNNGCDGGMTHGAFMDAASTHMTLLSQLDLPYTETTTDLTIIGLPDFMEKHKTPKPTADKNKTCERMPEKATASIENWEQVVGKDCAESSNPTELLKLALQRQPISVAINSGSQFKDYKGGIYECPNNGDFADSSKVDHAVVLVGYGSEGGNDYWILKNSYSSQWGEKGFLKLRMDSKINCGVNIFPVIPTGAKAGSTSLSVDGGGDTIFLFFSPTMWIIIASIVTIATTVLTAMGVVIQRRRRLMLQEAVMG